MTWNCGGASAPPKVKVKAPVPVLPCVLRVVGFRLDDDPAPSPSSRRGRRLGRRVARGDGRERARRRDRGSRGRSRLRGDDRLVAVRPERLDEKRGRDDEDGRESDERDDAASRLRVRRRADDAGLRRRAGRELRLARRAFESATRGSWTSAGARRRAPLRAPRPFPCSLQNRSAAFRAMHAGTTRRSPAGGSGFTFDGSGSGSE